MVTSDPKGQVSTKSGQLQPEGFRWLGYKDDHQLNAAEWIVYDALYAYCEQMIQQGKAEGAFR